MNRIYFLTRVALPILASATFAIGCEPAPARSPDGEQRPPRGEGGPGHEPPTEAFDACKNRAEADICTVKLADDTLTGICQHGPKDDRLACMPSGPPPGGPGGRDGHRGPPGGPGGGPGGPPPGGPGGPPPGQ